MPIKQVDLAQSWRELEPTLQRVYQLDKLYFPQPWKWPQWAELNQNAERYCLFVAPGGPIHSFALFQWSCPEKLGHLLKLLVHPDSRQSGHAQQLMHQGRKQLQALGARRFILEVEESNVAARNLYGQLGFRQIHKNKDFYGVGRHGVLMEQRINS